MPTITLLNIAESDFIKEYFSTLRPEIKLYR